MSSEPVRFVGGAANGLRDNVQDATTGLLPLRVECLGSVYRLVEPGRDQPPYYRFVRPAREDERAD